VLQPGGELELLDAWVGDDEDAAAFMFLYDFGNGLDAACQLGLPVGKNGQSDFKNSLEGPTVDFSGLINSSILSEGK